MIPTVGVWQKPKVKDEPEEKGLFKPKKKSVDEIMWLGAVSGFEIKEEPQSLRSKLVRKPETIPSQASGAVGPKAEEARLKKIREEQERERRLEAWANKKIDAPQKPAASGNAATGGITLPQPIEQRLRPRRLIGKPLQPSDNAEISNRPNVFHRPHMPHRDDNESYAPGKPLLPQPIETSVKNNHPPETKKTVELEDILWMGLPQPIETVRKSHRKKSSPEAPKQEKASEKLTKVFLPEPVESSFRSSRTKKPQPNTPDALLPQPIETSRKSNRAAADKQPKEIVPQLIETTHRSSRLKQEVLPEPVETTRRSNKSTIKVPESIVLPEPFETTRRSNRPQIKSPTTPPTPTTPKTPLVTSPKPVELLPQPVETIRRSNRPLIARPLVLQAVESSMRSSRTRIPRAHIPLELPQPIPVSRYINRAPDLRSKPNNENANHMAPGLYVPKKKLRGHLPWQDTEPPEDHVWHLEEPIDSAPASPLHSPRALLSPSSSQCPSLSSSPASTATSSGWEHGPAQTASDINAKKWGIVPPPPMDPDRDVSDGAEALESYAHYVAELEHDLKLKGKVGKDAKVREREKEESEYPFPITEDVKAASADRSRDQPMSNDVATPIKKRTLSSETIRPILRTLETEPVIRINERVNVTSSPAAASKIRLVPEAFGRPSDYPICRSPVYERFQVPRPPPTPEGSVIGNENQGPSLQKSRQPKQLNNNRTPLSFVASANAKTNMAPTAIALQPRLHHLHCLPTPPNSKEASIVPPPAKPVGLSPFQTKQPSPLVSHPLTAPPRVVNLTRPSPGYTVASLPPSKLKSSARTEKSEITSEFVDEVFQYLSLGFENIACKFDAELAECTGWTVDVVKSDRKAALKIYCERFVERFPEVGGGEERKGGFW